MNQPRVRRTLIGAGIVIAATVVAFIAWRMTQRGAAARTTGALNSAESAGARGNMSDMNMPTNGTVQLSADQLRQFGVTFGSVEERTLASSVRAVGVVTVDESRLTDVTARFAGYVERLYVDETGQRVHKGQPLMEIYSPELVAAEQELLIAATLQHSIGESSVPGVPMPPTDLMTAAKQRFAQWDISDAQIDEVLRTGKVRRTLTLNAPASGIVLEKNVVQGQAIQAGAMLYRIANLGNVWIDVALREQDASAVRAGSHAAVELTSYPGRPIDGRVEYVYPTLDQSARTVRARIAVPNPVGLLKPGMYATVTLTTPSRRALTVPTSAVLNTGQRMLVFMDMGGGNLMPMHIVTGRTAGEYTEVLSGLDAGQRVVTSAQYLLDSESNLGEVLKSMMGQMNTSDMKGTNMKGMKMSPDGR